MLWGFLYHFYRERGWGERLEKNMGKVFGSDDESLELSCYIIPNFNNIIR
jgi:hypothetical protein